MSATAAATAPQSSAVPATLADWLTAELDKKLATLADDRARYNHLHQQRDVWQSKFSRWVETNGASIAPHPVYGDIDAFDFSQVMSAIQWRMDDITIAAGRARRAREAAAQDNMSSPQAAAVEAAVAEAVGVA